MPATFDSAFAKWLTQHGEVKAQGVNVLSFAHPKWGLLHVSDYGDEFKARTEGGATITAQALGFFIDAAADNLSTEQRVMIRLDAANGAVMRELRSLSEGDLQTEVTITHRVYLDTKRDAPAFDPLTLYVTRVNAGRLAVELEASTEAMPNIMAGIRYRLERFPSLAYV